MSIKFTDSQQQAVTSQSREILTIAGAGSGKTKTLIGRLEDLMVNRGASPHDMLVLTFTRKAAGEMIARLTAAMKLHWGDQAEARLSALTIGTFHSIAFRWLRQFGSQIGYRGKITVVEPEDCELLLEQVAIDLGYAKRSGASLTWKCELSMKKVLADLNRAYSEGTGSTPISLDAAFIVNEYWSRLYAMNALDFGQILIKAHKLLEVPEIREHLSKQFKHVFVDELQDTDAVQFDLHGFLAPPAAFFGVGDRRQTIYSFRGARPDLMTDQHPKAEIVDLCDCFRCADRIVEVANSLISHNSDKLAKPMIGRTGRVGQTHLFNGRSLDIVKRIQAVHEDGLPWSMIAVLARTHRQLRRIADLMEVENVPCHRVGASFDITSTDAFRTVTAFMKLSVNKRDNIAFLRLSRGINMDQATYSEVRGLAISARISHFEAWAKISPIESRWSNQQNENVNALLKTFRYMTGTGYACDWWEQHCGDMSVEEALHWFAVRDNQEDVLKGNHVQLLTAHAAKGLEWPCVFVLGMNEGDWPTSQAIKSGGDAIEEERRLAYVAFTRAAESLHVHYRSKEDQAEGRRISLPSRFIQEAGLQ